MNVLLDIFSSTVIAALIFLIMMNFKIFTTDAKLSSDAELQLQTNTKTLAEVLDYDLRKIGYNYNGVPIITAEPKRFAYWADMNNDGTAERVTYFLGDSSRVPTPNPNDKNLFCVIGSDTSGGAALGLVDIKFTYKTATGAATNVPGDIRYIEVGIWTQSPFPVNKYGDKFEYLFNYWQLTVNPRNL